MRRVRKYSLIGGIAWLLVWVAGLEVAVAHQPGPVEALAGTVRVGVYENAPMVFVDGSGDVKGLYPDILEAVAVLEGWRLEYVPGSWPENLERLERGEIDLLTAIAHTREREARFDFTETTLLANWGMVYVRPGSGIESITDLQGKSVVFVSGDIYGEEFRKILSGFDVHCRLVEVDDYADVFTLLDQGRGEAGVLTRIYGPRNEQGHQVERSPILFRPVELRFAVPEGGDTALLEALDRHLRAFKADSESVYYRALDHWVGGVQTQTVLPPRFWEASAVAIGVALMLILGLVELRAQVRVRTRRLEEEIEQRKHVERRLLDSEKRLNDILNSASDAITIVQDGWPVYVNPRLEALTGYSAAEVYARPFTDFIHPDDREVMLDRHYRRQAGEEVEARYDLRLLSRDGSCRWIQIAATYFEWEGRPAALGVFSDVTERKKVEEALAESEERLRTLIDAMPDIVCFKDGEGRWLVANPFNLKLFGLEGIDYQGKTDAELAEYSPFYAEAFLTCEDTDERAWRAGKINREDEIIPIPESPPGVFDIIKVPTFRSDGRRKGLVVIGRDVTERRRAEEALRRSEEILRSTLDSLDGLLVVIDREHRILLSNWKGHDYVAPEERRTDATCFGTLRRQKAPCENCPALDAFRDGKPRHFESRNPVDGSHKEVRLAPIFNDDGRVAQVVGYIQDITKRKQAEEQARESARLKELLLDSLPHPAMLIRKDRVVLAANRIAREVGAYTGGLCWRDFGRGLFISEDMRQRVEGAGDGEDAVEGVRCRFCLADQALGSGEPVRVQTLEMFDRIWDSWWVPIDRDSYLHFGIDVTERVRAEEERTRLATQLEQSRKIESVGRLAGGVAHDFNNMLSPILGYSELLLSDLPEDGEQREFLEQIRQAALRARDLTRQLLAFGRKQALEMKSLNLNRVVRDFEPMLRRTIREDVTIETRLADSVQPIEGDPGQIEQVILNLAVNARDAMPEGGRLTIETSDVVIDGDSVEALRGAAPGRYVMIAVSDTGMGMDADTLERIFEPFFTTKNTGEGTGLGLATVYGIVKQHNGHIRADSEPGEGSRFEVLFPQSSKKLAEVRSAPKRKTPQRGIETVLVVEDETEVRRLACEILARWGYNVLEAEGGRKALGLAERYEGAIHLLLTDVIMPGLNGKELYEILAQRRPDVKVLFMSGYTDQVIAGHGVLEDGVHFLQKPFSVDVLTGKVREALDSGANRG